MVNLRRRHKWVKTERRRNTRIEFQLPVVIFGINERCSIVDFSLDGFFIAVSNHAKLDIGNHINMALRFPSEKNVLKIRAIVVYKDPAGIGCQFIGLTPQQQNTLEQCFNIFNSTLPV